jgi:indolepyruvate ferredoxin oxidoreductase
MHHAAGAGRVFTTDAQAIAQRMLGDTLPANIVMLGAAWQRGLVPLGEAALHRAIELNGVAVQANKTAFALGRLAVAAPDALLRLAGADPPAEADTLDALVERRVRFLTDYQDAAYAARYRALVERVRAAETALGGDAARKLALTEAVARQYARLLAVKDEYEVARLYTDGRFMHELAETFERWDRIVFHMAPPLLSRRGADGRPRKMRLGPWLMPVMRGLAAMRRLRGSVLDPFGHTAERRLERQLASDYEAMIDELLPTLGAADHALAIDMARVPERIRGFGHVKLANVATARARWREQHRRLDGRAPAAGPVRTIPIGVERVG